MFLEKVTEINGNSTLNKDKSKLENKVSKVLNISSSLLGDFYFSSTSKCCPQGWHCYG
jgi:hypothetical protein